MWLQEPDYYLSEKKITSVDIVNSLKKVKHQYSNRHKKATLFWYGLNQREKC